MLIGGNSLTTYPCNGRWLNGQSGSRRRARSNRQIRADPRAVRIHMGECSTQATSSLNSGSITFLDLQLLLRPSRLKCAAGGTGSLPGDLFGTRDAELLLKFSMAVEEPKTDGAPPPTPYDPPARTTSRHALIIAQLIGRPCASSLRASRNATVSLLSLGTRCS